MRWRALINSFERTNARDTIERFSLAIDRIGPIGRRPGCIGRVRQHLHGAAGTYFKDLCLGRAGRAERGREGDEANGDHGLGTSLCGCVQDFTPLYVG